MNDDDLFVQRAGLHSTRHLDGLTVMKPETGDYYEISETGAFVWERLAQPVSIAQVIDSASTKYDVSPREIGGDIQAFVVEMRAEELVRSANEDEES